MIRLFKQRNSYRKQQNNLLSLQEALAFEFEGDDKASIELREGQLKFYYEFFEYAQHGRIQSEGFTAYINSDFVMQIIHYKILNDKDVDMSRYDRIYYCADEQEVIDSLYEVIEEGEY